MGCGSSKSVESVVSSGNPESKLNIQDANENSDIEVEENNQIKPIKETNTKETEAITTRERVFSVGDKVHVSGYTGVVKFFGQLGDQGDEWVGIELDRQHSQGNDGRFQGVQHFTCKPKHGLYSLEPLWLFVTQVSRLPKTSIFRFRPSFSFREAFEVISPMFDLENFRNALKWKRKSTLTFY